MSVVQVLLPVFVQVLLTFVLLFRMGYLRVTTIRSGEVKMKDIALREPNWTPRTLQVANAFHNQLELPLLFYVLTVLVLITRQADIAFVTLAWIFVVLRVLHAWIHVTSNHVRRRAVAFMAGAMVLAVMWLLFMLRILFES